MAEVSVERAHRRRTITISTVVSALAICGVILPVAIAVMSPWAVSVMSNAMAGEISDQVKTETAPFNAAMRVLLESQIVTLEDDIESLKYRRDRLGSEWTEADNRDLTAKERRLKAHRDALAAMAKAQEARR